MFNLIRIKPRIKEHVLYALYSYQGLLEDELVTFQEDSAEIEELRQEIDDLIFRVKKMKG